MNSVPYHYGCIETTVKFTVTVVVNGKWLQILYTVSQKTRDYVFYNNFNNRCPITIIFGIVSTKVR